jgi:hypothetical protein
MELLVLDALLREQNVKQNHFLVMIAPELSKGDTNAKLSVGKT